MSLKKLFLLLFFFSGLGLSAQAPANKEVPVAKELPSAKKSASEKESGSNKDPKKRQRPGFFDKQELTSSDYLSSIEKANETMNTVRNNSEFERKTTFIFKEIEDTNTSINLITENLKGANNTNVRNQQMYQKVLFELQEDLEGYQTALNKNTAKLVDLKKDLRGIMKDTVFRKMIRDTVIRAQFKPELKDLKAKFMATDSLLKVNLGILNIHKTQTTEKKIVIAEALELVSDRLDKSGITMFGNECPNFWKSKLNIGDKKISTFIYDKFSVEIKAFTYYFKYSLPNTLLLIIVIGLLLWWIIHNRKYLKKNDKWETLGSFDFKYLNSGTILPVLVIALNIAIALNLYAPALYIEFIHLLLLLTLTFIFLKKWSGKAFRKWILLVVIFAAFSFIDLFLEISFVQRSIFILINIISIRFGLVDLKYIKKEMYIQGFFSWANIIFIGFNGLAILFNLFGRVSLAHTLSLTAIIALTQIIALSVFLKVVMEIITLQIYVIRLKRGIDKLFDFHSLVKNSNKPFLLLVIYLWIVVIASNLNISDNLSAIGGYIFNKENKIGSFSFTLGSFGLFFLIIWIAHILQKYVAFFFGEIEQENEENINKRQHSKLLITRLVLLAVGYLLAISASGMPLDKITIILGALGVGVGLGLQPIVNNFISGVILIFERPIQIGDVIESGTQSGRVKEINLRTTKIDTSNGAEVIIPNGNILSQNIVNWTYSNNYKLIDISFTISGVITEDEITETIISSLNTISLVFTDKEPQILFDSISEDKYKIKVKFWCNIYRTEQAISEARRALYESFKKKEISLND